MKELEKSIKELSNNIGNLNRNILSLIKGDSDVNSGAGFSIELLKDALLNTEVQKLLTEIVNYNQYNREPLVKVDRKPLENIQSKQVSQKNDAIKNSEIKQELLKEKIDSNKNIKILETLYTVKSPKNGYFFNTEKNIVLNKTQYQIEAFGNEGEFFIPESIDAMRFLLSPEKFLAPACSGDYDFDNTEYKLKKIKTIKKGVVKKDAKGWKIIEKAVIKVVKEKKSNVTKVVKEKKNDEIK